MPKNLTEVAVEAAAALMTSAGLITAVLATDIRAAAQNLSDRGDSYPQSKLEEKIAEEIRRNHRPGISGSL